MLKALIAAWQALSLLRKVRKSIESSPVEYLTQERVLSWRFEFEKIGAALARGDTKNLPRIVKWLFGHTEVDNHIGKAFGWFFKSRKLQTNDKSLDQPYYEVES